MDFSYTERLQYHVLAGKQSFEPMSLRSARVIAIRESSEKMQGEAKVYGPDFFQETYRNKELYCPQGYVQRLLASYGRILAHVLEHPVLLNGLLPYDDFFLDGEKHPGLQSRLYREWTELEEALQQNASIASVLSEGSDMLYYAACFYDQAAFLHIAVSTYDYYRNQLIRYDISPDEAEVFALAKYGECRIFEPKNIAKENAVAMQRVEQFRTKKKRNV